MASLTQDSKGNYKSRKRLPDDVREEYGRLYRQRFEAKFFAPASTKPHEAKRLFGEWLSEVEGRIANIRAQQKGEGVSLTREQARARRRVVQVVSGAPRIKRHGRTAGTRSSAGRDAHRGR